MPKHSRGVRHLGRRPEVLRLAPLFLLLATGESASASKSQVELRPHLRWAQTNTSVSVEIGPPRGSTKLPGCSGEAVPKIEVSIAFDRIFVSAACSDGGEDRSREIEPLRWALELREDVLPDECHSERLTNPGVGSSSTGLLVLLRKQVQHRWDRLLMDESSSSLPRDWKREDRNLPDEDEVDLPRAQNIHRLGTVGLTELAATSTVVVAMRYPWCTACEEKDKAFVKVSKVAGSKQEFSDVTFAVLDLREEKSMARQFWSWGQHACMKNKCPLHVFKPDEPFEEPYTISVNLLYEMDEMAMMSDPMAGSPGHSPRGQVAKPNFDRFEQDLSLLLSPALYHLDRAEVKEFRRRWETSVVGVGVNSSEFRRAARQLRGSAAFAILEAAHQDSSFIELWRSDMAVEDKALSYDGSLTSLNASYLAHYARVHSQPLVQNYSWDLKDVFEDIGLPVAVLWANYSDTNSTNLTQKALAAFRSLCERRRGTNASRHVLCCIMDQSHAYYQRDYGSHEPYPFPFFGLTKKLGFGEGDRFGYPFKEPVNATVQQFFKKPVRAVKDMNTWLSRVLSGRVPRSHESGAVPNQSTWVRGQVQELVWKTYQQQINGSTADVLLELYDNQRKKQHLAAATMDVIALTLKDYADLKIARMEVSQNYVPPIFGRKQYSKDTEYYWIPPSIATGEWSPGSPVRFSGPPEEATPAKLLRFLKKHTMSQWSLKEALEASADLSEEIIGRAKIEQREDDRAEEEKQQMIKKMMSTLKKEKGLVDVGEMMGLKKAADALGPQKEDIEQKKTGKGKEKSKPDTKPEKDLEQKRAERREQLKKEEEKRKGIEKKDKEKRKKRREEDKKKKEKKKAEEAERQAQAAKAAQEKRRKLEEQKLRQPTTPLFSWGQSKEQLRVSVSIQRLQEDSLSVNLTSDRVNIRGKDGRGRPHILEFELREFIVPENSSWNLRFSEENPLDPAPDGVVLLLHKQSLHRWDRLAQDHAAVKNFMKKDWVQDDGDLEEEHEEVDLPSGPNLKKVTAAALDRLSASRTLVVAAPRFPWCDKCKEKDRHFEKAARTSRDKDHLDTVSFVVIDAREEKYFAQRHNVTCSDNCDLLLFKQDEPNEPYVVPGRRFPEEVQIDCYKHLLPVVSEVKNQSQLDRVTSAFDTAIVGFFSGSRSDDAFFPRFRAVARQLRGHALFGATFDGLTPRDMGIDREASPSFRSSDALQGSDVTDEAERPLILLFKPKENRHVEFTGELTLETLTRFSKVLSVPLISEYSFESRQKYQELKVPLGMMWLDGEKSAREENAWAKEVLERLAHRFSGHLVFVTLNNTRDAFLMRPMSLDPRRVPAFGIATVDDMESPKFGYDIKATSWEELTSFWQKKDVAYDRLESFCASFLDGTLEASHESSELPSSYRWPGPGLVHEVVWKTFRDSVYRTEHDVLLELYSPMRPQHRTHVTVLDLVAEALGGLKTLKVARMDTANNYVLPEFGLKDKEKASTIFFLPAAPERHRKPRRFAGKTSGKAEELPERLLRFVHRETRGQTDWDLAERVAWVNTEAQQRIRRLRAIEKDYEKKMQDEWMQKEMEEFERYKRLGKFDNLPLG
mmetsp:Transcript_87340/g.154842  ORF Transcript_87340/g.154842 Transcript_87340/m.154842 type:complete len:1588 (-) Transcript_87340:74-4837(-)|eukprot:CAMPEP_0197632566 /NCGR_PEP_ID=MMETSP1338-20131121/9251_1 /TAXON_ID=43686 ORGANISM="Pelagodinium beii, Strain RCC1491" /NCGR_SAMPLE_ID=MMETSP1338 /ASSEMBLY_ACC=CAM_ASM_000754 /LENGTH=1587 /DNA_ID=CAMNT_0043204129 /DNA_START=85 /DNA_END=4848 /DNA_ORIENTATION=+